MNAKYSPMHKAFEFAFVMGQPYNQSVNDKDLSRLRCDLIMEEVGEVFDEFNRPEIHPELLTKELVDLLYVVYGAAVAFGLPIDEAYDRVHASNMSKLDDNGKPIFREDGKVLKGPNYKQADLFDLFN